MTYLSRDEFADAYSVAAEGKKTYRSHTKRLFDIGFVAVVALPVSLVVVALAMVIALDGHSPFYRQNRVGRNGRVFVMWKLRSMVPDAEHTLAAYLENHPEARAEWDSKQKLIDDPRITRLGRVIRKTSLDELPQFWNVLVGDMSVVGPRPMMVDQVKLYPGTAYYALRPGITGFWQVSERNLSSFAERAQHDTEYFQAVSFGTDLRVVMRTVGVVLTATGV
ncbi:sugar transferase [Shimia biformata]|uniref:sugar transferase n=1 Tax=Shimia biformata TaxID=1294299 RepID=UPI0019524527|nr:sugar transferase [Shimia biformata]